MALLGDGRVNAEALFSHSYREARARFLEAAEGAGFSLCAYPIAQLGPDGEQLCIDVARKAGPSERRSRPNLSAAMLAEGRARALPVAERALVLSSGTHGVEGYFGSAVQLGFLQDAALRERACAVASVVLIHALNPYGFAYKRRVNEDNVDLNRNFVLAGAPYGGAPDGYRELDALLNPATPPTRFEPFLWRALLAILRRGFLPLKNAVAQGQYEFPRGLFFGGTAASASQRIVREHLRSWLGQPERVVHLDFHSGVGKWASYALCIDLPESHPRVAQLKRELGARVVQGFSTDGVLYEIRGALGPFLAQCMPEAQYDCLLSEFGTYSSLSVLAALRFDNRVQHYARTDKALIHAAASRMLEAFCPRAPGWRRAVIGRALATIGEAVNALA